MNLDRFVTFERLTEGEVNGWNETEETWATVSMEWANKRDVSDAEKLSAGQEYSARIARFTVRHNPFTASLTGNDRLQYEGVWNIRGVKEGEGRNQWIEVTAEKRSD